VLADNGIEFLTFDVLPCPLFDLVEIAQRRPG
jgi:hypothetical protein